MISAKGLLPIIIVGLSSIIVVGCGNNRTEWFYASLSDAQKAQDGPRSWVRDDLLPVSSRNIHIDGELSPSGEWCAFEFAPADSDSLRRKLQPIVMLPPPVQRVRSPDMDWWPVVLKGNLDVDKIHKVGFELYLVEEPANSVNTFILLFAIDWQKRRGFFFETYRSD